MNGFDPPIPHIWFAKNAQEAAEFYAAVFSQAFPKAAPSRLVSSTSIAAPKDQQVHLISLQLAGQRFEFLQANSIARINPSVSFMVHLNDVDQLDRLWQQLSDQGQVMMPLDAYPWSERFGFLQDRFGVSWQLLFDTREIEQKITPSLLFVGSVCGRAEEAIDRYCAIFPNSALISVRRHSADASPDREGTILQANFTINGLAFNAMDSAHSHGFQFNESISFLILCDTQQQIDHCWQQLSANPDGGQCGWTQDEFGLWWQVVPRRLGQMLAQGTTTQVQRVTQAFLPMKKFDLAALEIAFQGD
jgi:predicted 3-demethylubiquinone-9 3-methyltransferase (glyoxalase superfamily)